MDAAIKDFEEASKLQPDDPSFDIKLRDCFKQKNDRILYNYYNNQAIAKTAKLRDGLKEGILDPTTDLVFTPKGAGAQAGCR